MTVLYIEENSENTIISEGKLDDQNKENDIVDKIESVDNLEKYEMFDSEEDDASEMNESWDMSNHSTNNTDGLIDFEEQIKNTVLAVRPKEEKTNECEICSKKFARQSALSVHRVSHVADHFCSVCCKSFSTKSKLQCHLSQHPKETINLRKNDPAFMMCKQGCVGKFYSKLQLYQHNEIHIKDDNNHICGVCHKRFSTFNLLNMHEKVHQPINCALCKRTYVNQAAFQGHVIRCHGKKNKPVDCKTCGAVFRHQGLLTNHETIHSDVKKYECAHCHKTFGRHNYLKDHIRTHFVAKPFKCEQCGSAFTQKNILATHTKMKHRICGLCNENVGDALQLRVHLWKFHDREDPEFEIVEIEAENDAT